jgi:hypothetical protein
MAMLSHRTVFNHDVTFFSENVVPYDLDLDGIIIIIIIT